MKVHFIAIGGSVMHHLAIALKSKGYKVTGSDDDIFEPSRSKLLAYGLLPEEYGWYPKKIHEQLDAVIVGMHAKKENPELVKAKSLGLKVYNFPEYIFELSKNKQRVVIGGSHGKTSVTSMLIHVLQYWQKPIDFLVGATAHNRNETVKITDEAAIILLEGDEYPSSPLDPRPKFLHYHQHIGVVTGIAWDHVNAYPVYEDYIKQFKLFIEASCKAGTLIYCKEDETLTALVKEAVFTHDISVVPYGVHPHKIESGVTYLLTDDGKKVPIHFFGEHNLMNVNAALQVSLKQGVNKSEFYEAISSFEGASKRLELIKENKITKVYRDFAHAPSKLQATVEAVKNQFPESKLIACMELHTFSSLNPDFIGQYKNTMNIADEALVYINPQTMAKKGFKTVSAKDIQQAFNRDDLQFYDDEKLLQNDLYNKTWNNSVLLLMSSGNFNNLDIDSLAQHIVI
jgi:UDP-N-acetylmuramate: L-alanyl-gamma-D-glutamyl-meso-diaminopimelate ligase